MWKNPLRVIALTTQLLVAAFHASSCQGLTASEALCAAQVSCGDCISASQDCAWCMDEETWHVTDTRCRLESYWSADGRCRNVVNPKSGLYIQTNIVLSDTVQVSPQQFNIHLRPGETVTFAVSVRPAENFPVDLYYLMDMSCSMRDDLTTLKKLGGELVKSLLQKTNNVRLGFGTFVDKTVTPYVWEAHLKLSDDCTSEDYCCRRPFSFINNLPLTSQSQLFVEKVRNESASVNWDTPEGGMDALMQVIVCGDEIGWRSDARRIVVMATDAGFHFAGDGKIGGAVVPHDGNCHLDKSGAGGRYREDVAMRLDYPSVAQIKNNLALHNIIPVFVSDERDISTYNNLAEYLTGAFTGILASDSSNVVSLIETIYDEIVSCVTPVVPTHQGITIGVQAQCTVNSTGGPEVQECHSVPLGREVKFMFNITAASCKDIQRIKSGIAIRFVGFGEVMLNVTPVCDCECESHPVANSSHCHGGTIACGQCQCLEGKIGKQCQCTQDNAEDSDNCRSQNATIDTPVCSGRGECLCGRCTCNENFSGEMCQCSRQGCNRDSKGRICGGNEQGECTCLSSDATSTCVCKCECQPGYTGEDCSCPLTLDTCKQQPSDQLVCSDHGVCSCGQCICHKGYLGLLCSRKKCTGEECVPSDVCTRNKDCGECYGFNTGPHVSNCSAACPLLFADSEIPQDGIFRSTNCSGTANDCTLFFTVLRNEDNTVYGIALQSGKECSESFPYMLLLLGLALGIAALVLVPLIMWKLVTRYKDSVEYTRFQEEKKQSHWGQTQNPVYIMPIQRNVNPTFGRYY